MLWMAIVLNVLAAVINVALVLARDGLWLPLWVHLLGALVNVAVVGFLVGYRVGAH